MASNCITLNHAFMDSQWIDRPLLHPVCHAHMNPGMRIPGFLTHHKHLNTLSKDLQGYTMVCKQSYMHMRAAKASNSGLSGRYHLPHQHTQTTKPSQCQLCGQLTSCEVATTAPPHSSYTHILLFTHRKYQKPAIRDFNQNHPHTHTHTYTYIYIHIEYSTRGTCYELCTFVYLVYMHILCCGYLLYCYVCG